MFWVDYGWGVTGGPQAEVTGRVLNRAGHAVANTEAPRPWLTDW